MEKSWELVLKQRSLITTDGCLGSLNVEGKWNMYGSYDFRMGKQTPEQIWQEAIYFISGKYSGCIWCLPWEHERLD